MQRNMLLNTPHWNMIGQQLNYEVVQKLKWSFAIAAFVGPNAGKIKPNS